MARDAGDGELTQRSGSIRYRMVETKMSRTPGKSETGRTRSELGLERLSVCRVANRALNPADAKQYYGNCVT